jgi:hypothetical protein
MGHTIRVAEDSISDVKAMSTAPTSGPAAGSVAHGVTDSMLAGPGSGHIDPRRLFTPDRQIWTVDRETVLLLGAGRALLLQFAHPQIRAGGRARSGRYVGGACRSPRQLLRPS